MMSKLLRVLPLLLMISIALGGGMVENTNQSADFVRMMARNASTDLDAVFFNPAGLTKLDNGMHLYLSSQTIWQGRTITSDLASLNSDTFEGTTFAPVFPNFYFAYKMDKLVFSAGFVPVGGGGSAEFADGLPSFEAQPSSLVPQLAAAGVTGYNLDVVFNGSSLYMGGQASISYAINDMISVSAGARFFQASNSYEGHLKNIKVTTAAGDMIPGDVMRGAAAQATAAATQATAAATGIAGAIAGGYPGTTLLTAIDADGALAAGLVAFGYDPTGYDLNTAAAVYTGAAAAATTAAATYAGTAVYLDAATADIEVDTKQTGTGFAPILGLNISLMDKLNIGLRYEMLAPLVITNDTKVDGSGLFPDGAETNADMPAMMGVGLSYLAMPSLNIALDYNMYFNTDVNWDGKEANVENGSEIAIGLEYALNQSLTLSGGYNMATSGALAAYQTDLSYSLNSSTFGVGAKYALNPKMALSFGFSSTAYEEGSKDGVVYAVDATTGAPTLTGNETYMKTATVIAVGLTKSF